MGRNKADIPIQGRTLLARQIDMALESGAAEVLVSLGPNSSPFETLPENLRIVRDRFTGSGPLAGIEACLEAARHEWVVVLAVDLPTMTPEYLRALLDQAVPNRGVLAAHQGRFEPLASLYTKSCVTLARQQLDAGVFPVQRFAARCIESSLAMRWAVPPQLEACLVNWNRPSDWTPPDAEARQG